MSSARVNYHTHTRRCNHATGEDEDYVLAAIDAGIEVLGFSDHVAWPYKSNYVSGMRMNIKQVDDYVNSIRSLREKYKDKIEILIGFECEYFPEYMDSLKKLIKDYSLDYIIFGNHFYKTDELKLYYGKVTIDDSYMNHYLEDCIAGIETGLYSYLAHPDLFMRGREVFDYKAIEISEAICKYAKENDVILEYNLEGKRGWDKGRLTYYPHDEFWKIAKKYECKAIIGYDAHNPSDLRDDYYYENAYKFLSDLGIEITEELIRKF